MQKASLVLRSSNFTGNGGALVSFKSVCQLDAQDSVFANNRGLIISLTAGAEPALFQSVAFRRCRVLLTRGTALFLQPASPNLFLFEDSHFEENHIFLSQLVTLVQAAVVVRRCTFGE